MMKETTLWAVKKGDEDWQEVVITSTADKAHVMAARTWAMLNGFDRLRESVLDLGQAPDFKKTIAE